MTLKDIESVAELFDLYRQFYHQPADREGAQQFIHARFLAKESVVLMAESDGQQVLGFCQLYPLFCSVEAAPIYVLYDLFVSPETRGLGIGRKLLLAAEVQAAQEGKVRMDLSTAKTNVKAQVLYESLGWSRDEVFFTYTRRIALSRGSLR